MTKLKTLKDLEEKYPLVLGTGMATKFLRQEAIKWAKDIQEDMDNATYWDAVSYRKQEWIKHFFNLTEEDLK